MKIVNVNITRFNVIYIIDKKFQLLFDVYRSSIVGLSFIRTPTIDNAFLYGQNMLKRNQIQYKYKLTICHIRNKLCMFED